MADRHTPPKSKYTLDRSMPGAFEGETVTRRNFMNLVTQGAGGVAAAAFTLPALGFALGPIFAREPFQWQTIGVPADFTESNYVTRVITIVWGTYFLARAAVRLSALLTLSTDQYVLVAALSDAPFLIALVAWSVYHSANAFRSSSRWGPVLAAAEALPARPRP